MTSSILLSVAPRAATPISRGQNAKSGPADADSFADVLSQSGDTRNLSLPESASPTDPIAEGGADVNGQSLLQDEDESAQADNIQLEDLGLLVPAVVITPANPEVTASTGEWGEVNAQSDEDVASAQADALRSRGASSTLSATDAAVDDAGGNVTNLKGATETLVEPSNQTGQQPITASAPSLAEDVGARPVVEANSGLQQKALPTRLTQPSDYEYVVSDAVSSRDSAQASLENTPTSALQQQVAEDKQSQQADDLASAGENGVVPSASSVIVPATIEKTAENAREQDAAGESDVPIAGSAPRASQKLAAADSSSANAGVNPVDSEKSNRQDANRAGLERGKGRGVELADGEIRSAKNKELPPGLIDNPGKADGHAAPLQDVAIPVQDRSVPQGLEINPGNAAAHAAPLPKTNAAEQATGPQFSPIILVPSEVGSRGWSKDFGEHVIELVGGRHNNAEIHLNPPELGPIRVSIEVKGNQATVQFTAAHAQTRDSLENALPKLQELFSQNNLSLGGANISSGDASYQRGQNQFQGQHPSKVFSISEDSAPEELLVTERAARVATHNGIDLFA